MAEFSTKTEARPGSGNIAFQVRHYLESEVDHAFDALGGPIRRSSLTLSEQVSFLQQDVDEILSPLRNATNDAVALVGGEQQRVEFERFVSFFPAELRYLFEREEGLASDTTPDFTVPERRGRMIVDEMADGEEAALAIFRALGSLSNDWLGADFKDQIALAAVMHADTGQFLGALQRLGDDREGWLGAARIFFREGFHKRIPAAPRTEWIVRLAKVIYLDDREDDKVWLSRFLSTENDPGVRKLLLEVFRGKLGKEINRARLLGQEPGLRTGAALSLALLQDASIETEVKQMLPQVNDEADVAALELSLALLGIPSYLKPEHFRLRSDMIGYAGLKAIERIPGDHGMKALVLGGLRHPCEVVRLNTLRIFERITGLKMSAREIKKWWKANRERRLN